MKCSGKAAVVQLGETDGNFVFSKDFKPDSKASKTKDYLKTPTISDLNVSLQCLHR